MSNRDIVIRFQHCWRSITLSYHTNLVFPFVQIKTQNIFGYFRTQVWNLHTKILLLRVNSPLQFRLGIFFPLSDHAYCFPLSDHPNVVSSEGVQVFNNFPTDLGDIDYIS